MLHLCYNIFSRLLVSYSDFVGFFTLLSLSSIHLHPIPSKIPTHIHTINNIREGHRIIALRHEVTEGLILTLPKQIVRR